MNDDTQVSKKVFLRLLGHPVVIAPFVLGATVGMITWAVSAPAVLGWFACFAGGLGSFGAVRGLPPLVGTRLLWQPWLQSID